MLLEKAETVTIEPKELNQVTLSSPKHEDMARVGLLFEDSLYLGAEPTKAAAHIGDPRGEPDTRACPQLDHRARLSSTARMTVGSAAPSMLSNARPGNSIVTLPTDGGAAVGMEDSISLGAAGSAAIVTGTRAVARFEPRGFSSPRSYCRFQRNTWLAFTPFARAMPATLAPGSSVSFTILSFSSTRRNTRRYHRRIHATYRGLFIAAGLDGKTGRLLAVRNSPPIKRFWTAPPFPTHRSAPRTVPG